MANRSTARKQKNPLCRFMCIWKYHNTGQKSRNSPFVEYFNVTVTINSSVIRDKMWKGNINLPQTTWELAQVKLNSDRFLEYVFKNFERFKKDDLKEFSLMENLYDISQLYCIHFLVI